MHNGNLSFFTEGEKIISLAPAYDMLPMIYAPQYEQIREVSISQPLFFPQDNDISKYARELAVTYWQEIKQASELSDYWKDQASRWMSVLI